ncbi:peptidyl-tRNA hydrolase [Methanocella paludicola SANAE]|uniref:Peptidyl-tRNA hydrolase n=1 Tax=Methanocella paludicola (strain DSM 17711 / JCM 13418 / NBRC 101707 / SANAE) TaxID=304371 RepID=D1YXR9_METPS|nr:peptidyl-tRNA hydrolase Pth2 [Methanocella paludicola]BAI61241.1 peptidyl-tRNA hydrolase [Methanocella paludicola SANAE]
MTEYKQCILVRDDLKLPKGKMAVQVAHASLAAYEWAKPSVQEAWKREGMKKIVLKVDKVEDLFRYKEEARKMDIPTALIQDAGLTTVPPGTITALGMGPADAIILNKIVGHLKLM